MRQSEPASLRRERDVLAGVVDGHRRQRRGSLLAQLVRVEQDAALGVRRVGGPQDVLVLEAGVAQLEPAVAATPRSAGPRVVPQLGETGPDRGSPRMAVEDARGQRVLGVDPRPRLGRIAVLERPVRIGDERAVVVVDLVGGRRRRVGHGVGVVMMRNVRSALRFERVVRDVARERRTRDMISDAIPAVIHVVD